MKFKNKAAESKQMSREEAAQLLDNNLKMIKRTIKTKKDIYPLDPKAIFNAFIGQIRREEFKAIRELHPQGNLETHLKEEIKNFMIACAYFYLEQDGFLQKIIIDRLKEMEVSPSLCPEILAFVTERLENNRLEKVKKFQENSKLTTFLFTTIRRLIIDYFRKHNKEPSFVKYNPSDTIDKLRDRAPGPEDHVIESQEEEIKKEISQRVPQKIEELDAEEKVAFKMFYHARVPNYCEIARVLGTSRFKAKKITQKAWDKIQTQIKKEITEYFFKSKKQASNNRGDNHETSR